MRNHIRLLLLIASILALPLPVAAQQQARWYEGLSQRSTITNCASIIQGFPYTEDGASTWVGYYANPNAGQPAPNTTYYVNVVVYGLGNSCSGQRAHIEVQLPANTSLAIDATNQVRCYNKVGLMGGCPQTFTASGYNPGAYSIPSGDVANGNTWPIPQGNFIEVQIPVRSSTALSNSTFRANVWMLDGNSSPWLYPQQGVYVFSGGGSPVTITYASPSTTLIQATTAHSEALLYTYGAFGTGYFQLGTTLSYEYIYEAITPITTSFQGWVVWDEWGPPALLPDTLYHWRFVFTPSSGPSAGSTIYGADQTFRTLPDGRVTVGTGDPAGCTASAFNTALATAKEILFDCGALPVTITLSSSHSVTSNLTIDGGNKVTLARQNDGAGNHFNVQPGVHLTLKRITLSNGTNTADCGGAIKVLATGQLTLNETRFDSNTSYAQGGAVCNLGTTDISATLFTTNAAPYLHGGAIGNYGSLTVTNSRFTGNTAAINGGGIDMGGTVTVTDTTFIANTAGYRGGGINTYGGTLTVTGSSFTSNTAGLWGGGLASDASTSTVSGSTFSDNSANIGGGLEMSGAGELNLTNSTVSGNRATTNGGGLYWYPGAGTGRTYFVNCTIANNSAATQGGNIYVGGVGVYNADIYLLSTLVANGSPNNCSGTLMSYDTFNNLEDADTCGLTRAADKRNATPYLGPLQDNGGPTWTHALLFGSAAIDAGDQCAASGVDQRGIVRPQGAHCDIGAYEALAPSGPAPGAFGKVGPVNGATAQAHNPTLSWGAATAAANYEYCVSTSASCAGAWTNVGMVTSASLTGRSYGTTYSWQVRARNTVGTSDANTGTWWSFTTPAAPPPFTDDPLTVRGTVVKAVHVTELRQAIGTLRTRFSLGTFTWTDATIVARGTPVKAVHLTELRTALNAVYTAAARTAPTYTHATVTGRATAVTALDIAELRAAILAIW